jgi:glycosyltransferase involved in cell wall biosynthesis
MLVTNVGGLPDLVPHLKVGIIAEPNAKAIAAAICELYKLGEDFFLTHLREEKKKYSWQNLTKAITQVAEIYILNLFIIFDLQKQNAITFRPCRRGNRC